MKISDKIKLALALPKNILIKKMLAIPFAKKKTNHNLKTFSQNQNLKIVPCAFKMPEYNSLLPKRELILKLADIICSHHFNLLGSGWVSSDYNAPRFGLEGIIFNSKIDYSNQTEYLQNNINSENIGTSLKLHSLIDYSRNYKNIDWQIDFKSGFRWNSKNWFETIKYGSIEGQDIKMPWELGRFQHLNLLCYAIAICNYEQNFELVEKYKFEIRNQILDFISANPPNYGVQWMTAMDVGIRAVNWLVCLDMLESIDIEFDDAFQQALAQSIFEHGNFISKNLEWSEGMRGNHYFINIVSLIFIAIGLNTKEQTKEWFDFATKQLEKELLWQFRSDGSNFEASTSYHLFTCEALFRAVILLEQYSKIHSNKYDLNSVVFSSKFVDRLKNIIFFTETLIENEGFSLQIGDNDSGRFLKVYPDFIEISNSEAKKRFLNLSNNLFPFDSYYFEQNNSERSIIELIEILKGKTLNDSFEASILKNIPKLHFSESGIRKTPLAFKDFGLYFFKNSNYSIQIRCGSLGQNGKGGHAHNDQLSFCLSVKGRSFFVDSGTYVYTPLHHKRNLYRSTGMHNTMKVENKEQNLILSGSKDLLFWLLNKSKPTVKRCTPCDFIGSHKGFGNKCERQFKIELDSISGIDSCVIDLEKNINFHLATDVIVKQIDSQKVELIKDGVTIEFVTNNGSITIESYEYSTSYGYLELANRLVISDRKANTFYWKVIIK